MAGRPRTRHETVDALETQLLALRASCDSYDRGNKWEAMRLASSVYIMLHDGGKRNKSILTQLGIRDKIRYISSARPIDPRNLMSEHSLVGLHFVKDAAGARAEYIPMLEKSMLFVSLREEPLSRWFAEGIVRDASRRILTRKNLIYSLRDQDGGSHFDEELTDDAYIGISRDNSMGMHVFDGAKSEPVSPFPHLASMRQVAWEIDRTISPVLASLREETRE